MSKYAIQVSNCYLFMNKYNFKLQTNRIEKTFKNLRGVASTPPLHPPPPPPPYVRGLNDNNQQHTLKQKHNQYEINNYYNFLIKQTKGYYQTPQL